MKKRLIYSLALVLLLFSLGAAVVIKNLDSIVMNQRLINEQDVIIARYNEMLFQMKGAQAELYRHQSGYTRNIDNLVNYIESFDETINSLSKQYAGHIQDVACMQCHSKIEERLKSLKEIFSEVEKLSKGYKGHVSILITTGDRRQIGFLEEQTASTGNAIIGQLEKIRHATDKMRTEIKNKRNILINRSRTVILSTIFMTIALSAIIFMFVIRSITVPVNALIGGIQKIAAGNFSERVQINTKNQKRDEIGFMAETFNMMAEKLNTIMEEKDKLLKTLQGFNEELEKRVKEATEELMRAQENMVRTETLAAVGTLAAGIAHEINNPLTNASLNAQTLKDKLESCCGYDDILKKVDAIGRNVDKAAIIARELLQFSRKTETEMKPVNINSIIDGAITLLQYKFRNINVHKTLSDVPHVMGDPVKLEQTFINILYNSIHAMPDDGSGDICIESASDNGRVKVKIADSGVGIPEENISKVFEPFFSTKDVGIGTGLGLSICYGIIAQHDGDIDIASREGEGTIVTISLPAADNPA